MVETAARVLRSEGMSALRDRLADEMEDRVRRLGYRNDQIDLRGAAASAPPSDPGVRSPVLYLLGGPPKASHGGVQAVVRRWLDEASRFRRIALLSPAGPDRFRLQVTGPDVRRSFVLLTREPGGGDPFRHEGLERALGWCCDKVAPGILHVLGLHGVALDSLVRSLDGAPALVTSVHDFAAFCFRPHLLERPMLEFCDYCRDLDRCHRCLRHDLPYGRGDQARRRELAERLLSRSRLVAFPSPFLSAAYAGLFPSLTDDGRRVVEPSDPPGPVAPRPAGEPPRPARIAFVGSALPHKGILVFEDLVRRLADSRYRFVVLGGGDPAVLLRLRRRPAVRVRGYYRHGSLPRLLKRERVDLALLLSVVPESYGLTLSECRAARVPVIAFDHGAFGDRIRDEGGGLLVPLASGAEGIAASIRQLDSGDGRVAWAERRRRAPAHEEEDWLRLYGAVLAGSGSAAARRDE